MSESTLTGVNVDRVRLLVDALRSGRFKKGAGALHRVTTAEETWCCLGVASQVARENGLAIESVMEDGREHFGTQSNDYLCAEVQQWFGFDSEDPLLRTPGGSMIRASSWNDDGADGGDPEPDFGPIADGFERKFLA